jgi:two-component system response regulator YesN
VLKLKDEILALRSQTAEWEELRAQFHENLELSREKLILYLIRTEQPHLEVGREKWRLYEMPLADEHIGAALIRIHRSHYTGEILELHKLAVQNLTSEILNRTPRMDHFLCDHNDELLVLWDNSANKRLAFMERMEEIRQSVQTQFPFVVTIGIGETVATMGELYYAFHTAFQAVESSFWMGANRIIDYQTLEPAESSDVPAAPAYPSAEEAAVLQCLRMNDAAGIDKALEDYFAFITQNRATPDGSTKQYVRRLITALISSVYHVCVERGLDCERIFGSGYQILDELNKLETFTGIKTRLRDCFRQIFHQVPAHKTSWKTVINALKYMEDHYSDDLNLEAVAQQVYVSPGYLRTLFKQELQKNFVDSLHEIRVAKAKELLRGGRAKIYEVAMRVGYHDEKYFSQIFKRIAGITPNQYRESIPNG